MDVRIEEGWKNTLQEEFEKPYFQTLAERTGFEPAVRLPAHTLSKRAPSTTRPPFRLVLF